MNVDGILVDMTATLAPEFISNPSFARDIFVVDVDGDSWDDVVIVNTFNQQPMLYMNQGEDAEGNWLGLEDDSQARLPQLVSDEPLICAVWAGDLTGNGAQDLYFVNYRVNSGGGTAKDFLLINDGTGHFTDQGESRAGNLLNSAFGTAGQIHDMDGDGDLDIVKNTTLYDVFPWNSRESLCSSTMAPETSPRGKTSFRAPPPTCLRWWISTEMACSICTSWTTEQTKC